MLSLIPSASFQALQMAYSLSRLARWFVNMLFLQGEFFLWRGACHHSVWAMVLKGALIQIRGSIANMSIMFLALFWFDNGVQVWATNGFWDIIHFLCFEEAGSLQNSHLCIISGMGCFISLMDGEQVTVLPASWPACSKERTGADKSIPEGCWAQ